MKLTNRERILIFALAICAILAASYFLMLKPQIDKISVLTLENANVRLEKKKIDDEIASVGKLQERFDKLDKAVNEKTKSYYPELLQPKLIVILDTLAGSSKLQIEVMGFTDNTLSQVDEAAAAAAANTQEVYALKDMVDNYKKLDANQKGNDSSDKSSLGSKGQASATQDAQNNQPNNTNATGTDSNKPLVQVEKSTVLIQYSGDYTQLTDFIKGMEAFNRKITIDSITTGKNETGTLSGAIQISFYAIPKLHDQDEEYLYWPYKNQYGKIDPFH